MTSAEQVAVALYEQVYARTDNTISELWPYEVDHLHGNLHHWNRPAHLAILQKAERVLLLVNQNLSLALALVKAV